MNDKTDLIERTLRVIAAMGEADAKAKGREEIARAANVPDSTTWRILKRLQSQDWAVYDDERRVWQLGPALVALAHAHRRQTRRRLDAIHSEYEALAKEPLKP
ncbi:MAG TPA: helix-turn-helix domain-containing protein [Gammaproteobacteria bacterium]|nr:helix-turn-helix domain-containing protein [Chromatiaceae bacterium]HPE80991.1 helix-turn-helix domain-containing protein [Gammaproteobacteria bacterium]